MWNSKIAISGNAELRSVVATAQERTDARGQTERWRKQYSGKVQGHLACPMSKKTIKAKIVASRSGAVFGSRRIMNCQEFTDADCAPRRKMIQELDGRRTHYTANCRVCSKTLCSVTTAEGVCNEWYQRSLHEAKPSLWHAEVSKGVHSNREMFGESRFLTKNIFCCHNIFLNPDLWWKTMSA